MSASDLHDSPEHRAIALGMIAIEPSRRFTKASQNDNGIASSRATNCLRESRTVSGRCAI